MKVNKGFFTALAAVGIGAALSMTGVAQAQQRPNQGGANSAQRLTAQNAQAALVASAASGFQTCASNLIALHNGVQTPTGTEATVALPVASAVTLTFSTEILAPSGGTVNLDYLIDGNPVGAIGPEFFADDSVRFVTRTAMGVTLPPFVGPLDAGIHTIQPVLTAFGGEGSAFFRCFTAVP
jgi:hypothetical protein